MLDREFVTRFLTFYLHPYNEYAPDLDTYMNTAMSELKRTSPEQREQIKTAFIQSMKLAKTVFADRAFRKTDKNSDKKKPLNKALFEAWSVALAKLSASDREAIEKRKGILLEKSLALINDDLHFWDSITASTGDRSKVSYRFSSVEKIIQETLRQ